MNGSKIIFLIMLFSLVVPNGLHLGITTTTQLSTQKQSNYPGMLEYKFNITPVGIQFKPSVEKTNYTYFLGEGFTNDNLSELRDVTVVTMSYTGVFQNIDNISLSLRLNGKYALNSFFETSMNDNGAFYFIVDNDSSMVLRHFNQIIVTINVGFNLDPTVVSTEYFLLFVKSMVIRTAYRQNLDISNQFPALIIDNNFIIQTSNLYFNGTDYGFSGYDYVINFLVILPEGIEQYSKNCYLNLTFTYPFSISIWNFFMEDFAIITTTTTPTSVTYFMRYVRFTPTALASGSFDFNPRVQAMYRFDLQGQFEISNEPVRLYPGSNEMGMVLFLNATLVIPFVLLSKLIYRRFFS